MSRSKLYLGLFCHGSHDAAVALVAPDGSLVFAAEQERFDRIKHSSHFPREAIQSAFDELNISWKDIENISFAWDPFADVSRILAFLVRNSSSSMRFLFNPKQNTVSRLDKWREMRGVGSTLASLGWKGSVKNYNHHLCHAASSFYTSGFESASCITVDGNGEIAATTIHETRSGSFTLKYRVDYPNSLGHFYAALTQFLGFQPMNDEYKVMGLAAFAKGKDNTEIQKQIRHVLITSGVEPYKLGRDFFQFFRGQDQMWSRKLEELLGCPRLPNDLIEERHEKIALAAQTQLEDSLLRLSKKAKTLNPEQENLCLAGGVALNCVANERVIREAGWKEVFIPPCPHDSGSAVGAAYLALSEDRPRFLAPRLRSASLGASLFSERIKVRREKNWTQLQLPKAEQLLYVADALAKGEIVAWAVGRGEFGPRALGNRSILADPRKIENKEKLNRVIKMREPFRPFAPVVLVEEAGAIFDMSGFDSPFMLRTVPVLPIWRDKIPAAIHIDGSARVQTLTQEANPRLHTLLREFQRLTGVPVLLNTSMNTAGEPIVNTAEEALSLFERTEIRLLVIDEKIFQK